MILDRDDQTTIREIAAVLIHETFHAFQNRHHSGWIADEADLFTYPAADPDLLVLSLLETRALVHTLADGVERVAWIRTALSRRSERFAGLPAAAVTYERQSELHEGLAHYVELRALGRSPARSIAPALTPAQIRRHAYATGAVLGVLLDALAPDWKLAYQVGETRSLDEYLFAALPVTADYQDVMSTADRTDIVELAHVLVAHERRRRMQARQSFLEQSGWRLIVSANDLPLQTLGFDPLNVSPLGSGEILHERYLTLDHDSGSVELFDLAGLTTAIGEHPLFSGIRTLMVTGLPGEPVVRRVGDEIVIEAVGLSGIFTAASVDAITLVRV